MRVSYRSGLFCVSMTAATGMPKFDTGPQKSGVTNVSFDTLRISIGRYLHDLHLAARQLVTARYRLDAIDQAPPAMADRSLCSAS